MEELTEKTERFKFLYERFITGCDSLEEMKEWNIYTKGEMDVYYISELLGIIVALITSDGIVADREVAFFNESFGFHYSLDELSEVYMNCKENFGNSFYENFGEDLKILAKINDSLAEAYKDLVSFACDIISESDGIISGSEIISINRLKKIMGK